MNVVLKSLTWGLLVLVLVSSLGAQQPESPGTTYQPAARAPEAAEVSRLAQTAGLSLGNGSAAALNAAGFTLYERQDYRNAATFFRAAVARDPAFVRGHFNLACVLSLSGEALAGDGQQELLYHLHRSIELEPARLDKVLTDSDLDRVRSLPSVQALVRAYQRPVEWEWVGGELRRVVGQDAFFVGQGKIAETFAQMPDYYYRQSPDRRLIVFIGSGRVGHQLLLATYGGRVQSLGPELPSVEALLYHDVNILFSTDSRRVAVTTDKGIWVWDLQSSTARQATRPEPDWKWDLPLEWQDRNLRFRRGSTFEYSFAGEEWEWNAATGAVRMVPGGRTWKSENLGAPDY